jgi:hypothetical protein
MKRDERLFGELLASIREIQELRASAVKYSHIDFQPPASVQDSARKGLKLRQQRGKGGSQADVVRATQLARREVLAPEVVRHLARYFDRHPDQGFEDPEEHGYVVWMLSGGQAGRRWVLGLAKQMMEADLREG